MVQKQPTKDIRCGLCLGYVGEKQTGFNAKERLLLPATISTKVGKHGTYRMSLQCGHYSHVSCALVRMRKHRLVLMQRLLQSFMDVDVTILSHKVKKLIARNLWFTGSPPFIVCTLCGEESVIDSEDMMDLCCSHAPSKEELESNEFLFTEEEVNFLFDVFHITESMEEEVVPHDNMITLK